MKLKLPSCRRTKVGFDSVYVRLNLVHIRLLLLQEFLVFLQYRILAGVLDRVERPEDVEQENTKEHVEDDRVHSCLCLVERIANDVESLDHKHDSWTKHHEVELAQSRGQTEESR